MTDTPAIAASPPASPAVRPPARILGFAGLLPQAGAVLVEAGAAVAGGWHGGLVAAAASVVALIYGAVILSFLGGIWWGLAMRRADGGQGGLALLAVLPSLAAAALVAAAAALDIRWVLVLLGSAILLTLPVDRHLAATGDAPAGWMRLRVPLSVGLGGLTILAGILAPG